MPLLLWLSSAFTGGMGFVAANITKKFVTLAVGITALIALAVTLKAGIDSAISSISAAAPTGAIAFGLGLLPSNTVACITAITTAMIASAVYRYQRSIVMAKMTAN